MTKICSNCNLNISPNTRHGKVENGTCVVTGTPHWSPSPVNVPVETGTHTADHSPQKLKGLADIIEREADHSRRAEMPPLPIRVTCLICEEAFVDGKHLCAVTLTELQRVLLEAEAVAEGCDHFCCGMNPRQCRAKSMAEYFTEHFEASPEPRPAPPPLEEK